MTDEIKQLGAEKIKEYLELLEKTALSGVELSQVLFSEILSYSMYHKILIVIGCVLVFFPAIYFFRLSLTKYKNAKWPDTEYCGGVMFILVSIAAVSFAKCLGSLSDIIKILCAPRLFLIEYLRALLK